MQHQKKGNNSLTHGFSYQQKQERKNTMWEKENIQKSVDVVFPSVLYLVEYNIYETNVEIWNTLSIGGTNPEVEFLV